MLGKLGRALGGDIQISLHKPGPQIQVSEHIRVTIAAILPHINICELVLVVHQGHQHQ